MKKGRPLTKEAAGFQKNAQRFLLKKLYGLTLEGYNKLYKKQKGCCAICGRHQCELRKALGVDHDHLTGKIRGLLCHNCNLLLGFADDSRGMLLKAMQYLRNRNK